MAVLMTRLCEKGVELIWKQCDESRFSEGLECLEKAVQAGDAEALFFLGHCYSWGDGAVGFNDKKAYECYREGARSGSYRCVLGALRSGQYDEEFKAAARHSPAESFEMVKEAAEIGEAFAAYQIAEAFEWETLSGILPEKERKPALCFSWYKMAAKGGIVAAMVKAGKCCLNGDYINKDPEKYVYYAEQAASRGNAWGLYHMGLYHLDCGNPEAAFEYFDAAAIQGDKKSPCRLGRMYLNGQGTEKNIEKAVEAFETAAVREDTDCLLELGDIFYRDEVVERDDERAFYWYMRAYAAGEKKAALPLGKLYLKSWENQDIRKAEKLFAEAAESEASGEASLALGNLYLDGKEQEPDLPQAIENYEAGAKKGNAECMEILGNLYLLEEENGQDYEKAFYWLSKALEAGTLQSYEKLAFLHLNGYGCEVDEEKAEELYEKATETECDGTASYELGYIYERRNESPDDLALAAEYYQRAIEMGNESADRRFAHFKKNLFGRWKVTD